MKMNVGQTIEIIYQDKSGKMTQRKIEIVGIRDGRPGDLFDYWSSPSVFGREHPCLATGATETTCLKIALSFCLIANHFMRASKKPPILSTEISLLL